MSSSWPPVSGDAALVPTTSNPRTPQLPDEYGNQTYYGTTDNADPSGNFPIDPRIVEFIENGVLNGSFSRGPADENHDITDINPLPDWTGPVSVSGGAITWTWVADSGSPSGYNLRATLWPGAAGDEAYFQQTVPIGGSRSRSTGHVGRAMWIGVSGDVALMTVYLDLQYLDATGAAVGNATEITRTDPGAGFQLLLHAHATSGAAPPATAHYLQARVGVRRGTAVNATVVDLTDVRIDTARPRVLISDDNVGSGGFSSAVASQRNGQLSIGPNGGGDSVSATAVDFSASALSVRFAGTQALVLFAGGDIIIREGTAPATPPSGYHDIYAKSTDSLLYSKDDSGNEYLLSRANAVTASGLTMSTAKMLGRATAGTGAVEEIAVTGSGSAVLATSPTLVTPALGTPSALVLTNATGTPSAITLTNGTGLPESGVTSLVSDLALKAPLASPSFTGTVTTAGDIELGNASDTTIHRTGAGAISVEGVTVALNSTSLTHTASTIELGAATDTTLSRASAGVLAVEGVNVLLNGGALGTPSSGTGTNLTGIPESGVTNLTTDLAAKAPVETSGTFTPTLTYTTPGTSSWAVTTQLGWWKKQENVVFITMLYSGVPTNGTASGNLLLNTDLAATPVNTTNELFEISCAMQGWTKASYTQITLDIQAGTASSMVFRATGSGQARAPLVVADIPTGGTVVFRATGFYFTT